MTTKILAIFTSDPAAYAGSVRLQSPTAIRLQVGQYWVDYEGDVAPVLADLQAILAPPIVQVDQATLNAALAAPGSVVRGLAMLVLDIARGAIPINPGYTTQQLVDAIQQRMR